MSKTKWSAEKTWQFVIEYRMRECLWNTKLQSYKDRQMKDCAYNELAGMFTCGMNDVKIKIKNLRTTYIQEHKKIQESIRVQNNSGMGNIYVPSLVWYKEMDSFLHYNSTGKISPIDVRIDEKIVEHEDVCVKEEAYEVSAENAQIIPIPEIYQPHREPKPIKEVVQPTSRKRRQSESYPMPTDQQKNGAFEEHEFDIFGKSVAKQLKSFSSIAAALRVQSQIQSLLTEERIQDQLAATDDASQRRFFYKPMDGHWSSSSSTEVSIMLPSSDESSRAATSGLEDNKQFEVNFIN